MLEYSKKPFRPMGEKKDSNIINEFYRFHFEGCNFTMGRKLCIFISITLLNFFK
jgi:hypothetical protein